MYGFKLDFLSPQLSALPLSYMVPPEIDSSIDIKDDHILERGGIKFSNNVGAVCLPSPDLSYPGEENKDIENFFFI